MIVVIASICLGAACHDVVVTTSAQDERVNMMSCLMGPPGLADWLARDWPGYTLAGWKCMDGERRRGI